jgi:hypothetical protein
MVITYSPDTVPLQHAELGDAEFTAIGRIIRACADIEDLITLSISTLMRTEEGCTVVALGQTAISKKLAIANYLAGIRAGDLPARYNRCFDTDFKEIIACRNAIAHGVMLGKWANGRWAFLTAKTEEPKPGTAVQVVVSFTTVDLQLYADLAAKKAAFIEETLELEKLRLTRRGRSLQPHKKSQPKAKQGAKPKRPPRSSKRK